MHSHPAYHFIFEDDKVAVVYAFTQESCNK